MSGKPTARSVAAIALARVTSEGAFAAPALDAELSRAVQLEPRDRALATELVYGALRVLPWLEARLDAHARKPVRDLPQPVRAHLGIAAYQLFFTRVPAFAAVNEAVGAVRSAKGQRMSAFANAILRKLASEAAPLSQEQEDEARLASIPAWMNDALVRSVGNEAARALVSGAEPPPTGLRVDQGRDTWIARLREARPEAVFELGRVSPLAILAKGAGKVEALPGYAEGAWSVQEEGSQVVALALGAKPGESVLDACAGRGNKTAILARAVGPTGAVDACDVHPKKLGRLRDELARVGLVARATFAVDWTVGSGDVATPYDRVLVDAPCSGSGTLRRRPEIAIRRASEDLATLAALQLAIVRRAAKHVKPGGTLVYAVCSVLREEGEAVVQGLLSSDDSLRPEPFDPPLSPEPVVRLLPHVHGTDGYFLARLKKR
jgi:16S rRNA (cytosine967-C5)-methyltransferase